MRPLPMGRDSFIGRVAGCRYHNLKSLANEATVASKKISAAREKFFTRKSYLNLTRKENQQIRERILLCGT
jgi:hypothetical protein